MLQQEQRVALLVRGLEMRKEGVEGCFFLEFRVDSFEGIYQDCIAESLLQISLSSGICQSGMTDRMRARSNWE